MKVFPRKKSETQLVMQKSQSGVMQFISAGVVTHYFLRNVLTKSSSIKIIYCNIYVNSTLF
jgi:hypothetical protein